MHYKVKCVSEFIFGGWRKERKGKDLHSHGYLTTSDFGQADKVDEYNIVKHQKHDICSSKNNNALYG